MQPPFKVVFGPFETVESLLLQEPGDKIADSKAQQRPVGEGVDWRVDDADGVDLEYPRSVEIHDHQLIRLLGVYLFAPPAKYPFWALEASLAHRSVRSSTRKNTKVTRALTPNTHMKS